MAEEKKELTMYDRAAAVVKLEMDERASFHSELTTKIENYWKHWDGEQVESSYREGLAKTFPMETFTHVETWVPRLVTGLLYSVWPFFGIKDKLKRVSTEEKEAEQTPIPAAAPNPTGTEMPTVPPVKTNRFERQFIRRKLLNIKKMLLDDLDRMGFESYFELAMRNLAVEGSLVVKVPWDMEEIESRVKLEKEMEGGFPKETKSGKPKLKKSKIYRPFDGPKFLPRKMENIYLDDNCEFKDQSVIEKCEISWEEFWNDEKNIYKNKELVKELVYDKATPEEKARGIKLCILERWGKFILDADAVDAKGDLIYDDIEEGEAPYPIETVIVTLYEHQEVCIRVEKNPFWHGKKPYLFVPFVPKKHQLHGKSIPEILFKDQVELADTHNQAMDDKSMLLWGEMLVNRNAGIKKKHLEGRKVGKVIFHNAPTPEQAMGRVPYPDFTATAMNMEGIIRRDMVSASGASLPMQGIKEGGRETATAIERRVNEAGKRISLVLQRVENEILLKFLEMCYDLDVQYKDEDWLAKVLGNPDEAEAIKNVTKADILADIEFELYGVQRMENDLVKRKEAENRMMALMNDPHTNQIKLRRDFWETQGVDNPDEYINEEQMIPASKVQQMIAAMQQKIQGLDQAQKSAEATSAVPAKKPKTGGKVTRAEDIYRSLNPMEAIRGEYAASSESE